MFESWGPVHIMQFLRLIDNSFDVLASHQSDFANHISVSILFRSEVEVGDMASCLKAIWIGNRSPVVPKILETVE